MKVFDHIAIIYNPKSSGDAAKIAKDLRDSIDGHFEIIQKKATLYPAPRIGDAIDIADDVTRRCSRPLIVSVGGDSDYNEVVNGIMRAKKLFPAQKPVVTTMSASNTEDNKRVLRDDAPLIRLIKNPHPHATDLISITAKTDDFELVRYAHSHIGFGITPEIGHELNYRGTRRGHELWLAKKTLHASTPHAIMRDGVTRHYDSLVFEIINQGAKVNTAHANQFAVIATTHRGKPHVIRKLFHGVIHGLKRAPRHKTYSFATVDPLAIQLDGEIEQLPAHCSVTIKSHSAAIESLR